jgi:hypothetical protein
VNLALIPLLLVALLMAGADPGLDRAEVLWDGRHEVVEHEGVLIVGDADVVVPAGTVVPGPVYVIEVWFSIIERQAIHRGTYRSVKELNAKIRSFIDAWNDQRAHPFVWTKTADEILKKANPQKTSKTDH